MPEAPNLAGQTEEYLVKALNEFRSGARQNEMMGEDTVGHRCRESRGVLPQSGKQAVTSVV